MTRGGISTDLSHGVRRTTMWGTLADIPCLGLQGATFHAEFTFRSLDRPVGEARLAELAPVLASDEVALRCRKAP